MRHDEIKHNIQKAIASVAGRRHRLIIVTDMNGISESEFEELGLQHINLNLLLSQKLMEIPQNRRSRSVATLIGEIVSNSSQEPIPACSNFELLFLPELQIDFIRLFEELSKRKTIIFIWPGKYEDGVLSYAEPWHPEYAEYGNIDAIII